MSEGELWGKSENRVKKLLVETNQIRKISQRAEEMREAGQISNKEKIFYLTRVKVPPAQTKDRAVKSENGCKRESKHTKPFVEIFERLSITSVSTTFPPPQVFFCRK